MSNWLLENWITLLGTALAAAALPCAFISARRWGTRRARLQVQASTTSLSTIQFSDGKPALEISFSGTRIINPHYLQIEVSNTGPRDIASSDFDGEQPIEIRVASDGVGILGLNGQFKIRNDGDSWKGVPFQWGPGLIKRGEGFSLELITEGQADIEVTERLINTEVITAVELTNSNHLTASSEPMKQRVYFMRTPENQDD